MVDFVSFTITVTGHNVRRGSDLVWRAPPDSCQKNVGVGVACKDDGAGSEILDVVA